MFPCPGSFCAFAYATSVMTRVLLSTAPAKELDNGDCRPSLVNAGFIGQMGAAVPLPCSVGQALHR
jgi:hypothetical protein